jgi:hypothetical protein
VDDWPGLSLGDRGLDPHLRLRLGHGIRVFRDRDRRGLSFLLLLGTDRRANPRHHRLDLRPVRLDEPGADYGHYGVHAAPGPVAGDGQFLVGLLQPAVRAAGGGAHRRGAAPCTSTCTPRCRSGTAGCAT